MYHFEFMLLQAAAAAATGSSLGGIVSAVAGAIPVVGTIVSSLIQNHNTDVMNQANEDFQLQQQQQQEAYNTEMWNMENQYNSPAAQMQRLQDAGLNPNLVYGSGETTGNVASAPAVAPRVEYVMQPHQAPNLGAALEAGVSAMNATAVAGAQTNNLAAQASNTAQDTVLKQAQTVLTDAQTNQTVTTTGNIPVLTQANLDNLASQTAKNAADANNLNSMLPYSLAMSSAQTNLINQQVQKTIADTNYVTADNIRQAALTNNTLRLGLAQLAQIAVSNAKSQAEIDQINQNVKLMQNSQLLSNMDINMRNAGITPGSNPFFAALGALAQKVFGVSYSTGAGLQNNGASQLPTSPAPSN